MPGGGNPETAPAVWWAPVAAFLLAAALLVPVQATVRPPMLLAERFVPGSGWVEVLLLCLYASWLAHRSLDERVSPRVRRITWRVFSAVFFGQLLLGLAGIEECLMSGKLHLPVPAMIVAGPLFRGQGFFMPILLATTVVLVGPAWCSHLCYIGAWDDVAARSRRRAGLLPRWRNRLRVGMLAGVVATALALRVLGAAGVVAAILGGAFGIAGVVVMALWSRASGAMAHCAAYCPIGWLATTLGSANPFRIRIDSGCNRCGVCTLACRYDALRPEHIESGRAGPNCTLCGDCITSCGHREIRYDLLGLRPRTARALFLVLVVSLHAAFLGLARL
jgi:polyferredoxin